MNLLVLLDMVAAARGDAVAVQVGDDRLTAADLLAAACGAAPLLDGADAAAYVAPNGIAFPVGLFAAAAAGVPFVPLNYRLAEDQRRALLARQGRVVVVDDGFAAEARVRATTGEVPTDGDGAAVLLHTSGTTAAPKAAVLRHRHLAAYLLGTVEFASAGEDEAVLVSVPPYHVAGVANLLSNLYAGRRIVYLPQFDAAAWIDTVRRERITHAMVVPTMLARLCEALETSGAGADGEAPSGPLLPSLRSLAYGGARTPATVLQRAVGLLPDVDFTNAYGLTETSSTIAVLGPDDHRAAAAGDPVAVARLSSAGKVLPTVEVDVRDGEIWVRGEQVSGEYAGVGAAVDDDGWFPTRDRGWVDDDGYLFVEGRSDDTIIRGGENVAPAEVEEALLRHPGVAECAVVGLPDEEWGQRIAAAVVLREGAAVGAEELREHARGVLRGSKTPDVVAFVEALPYTDTGKLLRRVVQDQLSCS